MVIRLQVLPFCLFNVALLCALTVVDRYVLPRQNLSIDVSRQGHTFINIVVSFLLLSRVRNGMERYNRACDYLHTMIRSIQAVVQDACVLSSSSDGTTTTSTSEGTTTGTNDSASAWRHEVAYRSLMLLRASMAVMDFPIKRQPVWDLAEWNGVEQDYILRHYRESLSFTRPSSFRLPWTRSNSSNNLFASTSSSTYLDEDDVLWELSLRIPARLEFLLQTTLHSQRLRLEKPIQCSQETRLFTSLAAFMTAYGGMCKFLTTVRTVSRIGLCYDTLLFFCFSAKAHWQSTVGFYFSPFHFR